MSIFDQQFNALIDAAERQRGPNPSSELRDALNAFAQLPAENRPDNLARLATALPDLKSPAGAGFLAVWLGAGVEQGDDPEGSVESIFEAFVKWCRTLETVPEGDDPEPDEETLTGMSFFGQALVAHLSRSSGLLTAISASEESMEVLERVEHLSIGATWVLELLRQRSGRLVVLEVAKKLGFLVRYENIANCFHLFTLLQGALAQSMPRAGNPSEEVLAVARGQAQEQVSDEAWWHYGQGNISEPNHLGSVWGEKGPDHISTIDGEQVLLLWPKLLANRSWDAGFFGPTLEAAPPNVKVERTLAEAEVEQWWSRLDLPRPKKAWWRLR